MESKPFPWRRGMLTADGERIVEIKSGIVWGSIDCEVAAWHLTSMVGQTMAPDLNDGATKGALAETVRELYADPTLHVIPFRTNVLVDGNFEPAVWWCVARVVNGLSVEMKEHVPTTRFFAGPTEPAAWLAAYHAHKDTK